VHLQFCVSNITWKNSVTLLFCSHTIAVGLNKVQFGQCEGLLHQISIQVPKFNCFFCMHFSVYHIVESSNFGLCICWNVEKVNFVLTKVSLFVVGGYGTILTASKFKVSTFLLKPTFCRDLDTKSWLCLFQHYFWRCHIASATFNDRIPKGMVLLVTKFMMMLFFMFFLLRNLLWNLNVRLWTQF